jgi:hypothetical protein
MNDKGFTTKQMGDAAEMLVAAHLTLHGIPSFTGPANWPGYDVIAAPKGKPLQKVSVKCRGSSSINFRPEDFDWLAIVLINKDPYQFFVIPKKKAAKLAKRKKDCLHTIYVKSVPETFKTYKNNFQLRR